MSTHEIWGYVFKDTALLEEALTMVHPTGKSNYRRLAFLGDRVLGVCVAEWLHTTYPNLGLSNLTDELQRVVSNRNLRRLANSLGLGERVICPRGMEVGKEPMANIFEAVTAAIFLDSGKCYATVSRVIVPLLFPNDAPAQRAETSSLLSDDDLAQLACLLGVTSTLPPLPPVPDDLREAIETAPVYDFEEVARPLPQDPVNQVREMVHGMKGVTPVFRIRRDGVAGGKVVVDVMVGWNGSSYRLGSGQGKSFTSASRVAAVTLLKDDAMKLRRSLRSVHS